MLGLNQQYTTNEAEIGVLSHEIRFMTHRSELSCPRMSWWHQHIPGSSERCPSWIKCLNAVRHFLHKASETSAFDMKRRIQNQKHLKKGDSRIISPNPKCSGPEQTLIKRGQQCKQQHGASTIKKHTGPEWVAILSESVQIHSVIRHI